MRKRRGRLVAGEVIPVAAFAVGCFGLLLYLWAAFGGPVPLGAHGYRVSLVFPDAAQLAGNAQVRVAGVPVGKVIDVRRTRGDGAHVRIELQRRFAPLHADARATLRQKSLLGETYVELAPGAGRAPAVPENGALARGQVASSVALDQVYRVLDTRTRAAFQTWMQATAAGLSGRGAALNQAIGLLAPFVDQAGELTGMLAEQDRTLTRLVRDSGGALEALGRRPRSVRAVVTGGRAVVGELAAEREALARGVRQLAPFEREARATADALDGFARTVEPPLRRLVAAASGLSAAAVAARPAVPALTRALDALAPLGDASGRGFPALAATVAAVRPAVAAARTPALELRTLGEQLSAGQRDVVGALANVQAATSAGLLTEDGRRLRYLRVGPTVQLESLTAFPRPPGPSRSNAYRRPGVVTAEVFDARRCAAGAPVIQGPATRVAPEPIIELLAAAGVTRRGHAGERAEVAAPRCVQQPPFVVAGVARRYPQVRPAPGAPDGR